MNNKIGAAITAAILSWAWPTEPAQAQTLAYLPTSSAAAEVTGEARPVFGWVDFCRRHPQECAVNTAEPAVIPLSPRTWQTIVQTNRKVNTTIQPITDQEHWGLADRWDLPNDGYGDCEDFQLLKRKLLAEAGLPRRAMRVTVVIDEKGEGHAVLMVRTDRGDFVLDNKTSAVLPWHQTGYVYVKREGQAGLGWVSLGGATSPVVTANR
jgi:predicted transglutaminase-like cysteine proteinase